jgi:hypothetical protein
MKEPIFSNLTFNPLKPSFMKEIISGVAANAYNELPAKAKLIAILAVGLVMTGYAVYKLA